MNLIDRLLSLLLLTVTVLLLSHCTPADYQVSNIELRNPYPLNASAYLKQAQDSKGELKQALLLKAAGRLINDGNWQRGMQILSRVKGRETPIKQEKQLLQAQVDLMRNRAQEAMKQLSAIDSASFHREEQIRYHRLLAKAYEQRHSPVNGVEERIKLEQLLPNETLKQQNRRKIWLSLSKLTPATLTTLALEAPEGSELQAWMTLASIPRQYGMNPKTMVDAITQWQAKYAGHPGSALLRGNIKRVEQSLSPPPTQIAVLLPLTGPVSGPGKAVRDGFMAGFYQKKPRQRINVRFYDTYKEAAASLYRQAIAEGAQYVVGPLLKSNVEQIATLTVPVPTVALNDIPGKTPKNLYQLGLSPNEEARQVALKARSNGLTKALVIAPRGEWGTGIVNSFSDSWVKQGGVIVDSLRFEKGQDFNQAIKSFLHITQSQQRERELKKMLGAKLKTISRRRQDFDVIFLLAYSSQARQIRPMLKYYYAGDVPVYATSTVYAANSGSRSNRDLEGIIFCDMPWIFKHKPLKKTYWPEQLNSYDRLYALGLDSYSLATQLNQLLLFPAVGVDDNTGILYLQANHRLNRLLEWAQFKQGQVQVLS